MKISASIVLYNNRYNVFSKTVKSLLNYKKISIFIVDNSTIKKNYNLFEHPQIHYIPNKINNGFGAGHNIVLKKTLNKFDYHFIVNPDVKFEKKSLEIILKYLKQNDIGALTTQVRYFDNNIQNSIRYLPSPFNLISNRLPFNVFKNNYEISLNQLKSNVVCSPPWFSGCFFIVRLNVLKKIGLFDERYFMYMEDVDLIRRISEVSKTVYLNNAYIYHAYNRQSKKELKLFFIHIISAIKYFNKWGWFLDRKRRIINNNFKFLISRKN